MSKIKSLPSLLNIPPKLLPIIEKLDEYRYFLLDGGRGSAKTQSIARFLLYLASHYKLRICCGREIQKTIEESVYTILRDIIIEKDLPFDVFTQKIVHKETGAIFIFKGFREQGSVNIKGLEGIDILWVDEAQSITKKTLDIIIPTIRKQNSKIFWSMNRYLKEDPVFVDMHDRGNCLHIHIDYFENPHCPQILKVEAQISKEKNIEDYNHIWLGQPLPQSDVAAFRNVESIIDHDLPERQEPVKGFHYVLGADYAKSMDHTAFTVLCIELKIVVYFEEMESENKTSWNAQKERTKALALKYNDALVVPDSTGVGDPITEDLQRAGLNVYVEQHEQKENKKEVAGFKFTTVSKKNLIEKLKVAIELMCFRMPNIKKLVKQCIQYQAIRMPSGSVKYSCPEGKDEMGRPLFHDDGVISTGLAIWGSLDMIYNPDYQEPKERTRADDFWSTVRKDIIKKTQNNSSQDDEDYDIIDNDEEFIDMIEDDL